MQATATASKVETKLNNAISECGMVSSELTKRWSSVRTRKCIKSKRIHKHDAKWEYNDLAKSCVCVSALHRFLCSTCNNSELDWKTLNSSGALFNRCKYAQCAAAVHVIIYRSTETKQAKRFDIRSSWASQRLVSSLTCAQSLSFPIARYLAKIHSNQGVIWIWKCFNLIPKFLFLLRSQFSQVKAIKNWL